MKKHNVRLNTSLLALKEETIVRRDLIAELSAQEKEDSDLKAENSSIQELKHEVSLKALLHSQKTRKNRNGLSAAASDR